MTVRDIFSVCNNSIPVISIYDEEYMCIFQKEANKPLGKCNYLDCEVLWINEISSKEIRLKIKKEN